MKELETAVVAVPSLLVYGSMVRVNDVPTTAVVGNAMRTESPVGSAGFGETGAFVVSLEVQTILDAMGAEVAGIGLVLKVAVFPGERDTMVISRGKVKPVMER